MKAFLRIPLLCVLVAAATAQETAKEEAKAAASKAAVAGKPDEEAPVVTSHEIALGGKQFRYRAEAGAMPMRTESGELKARMFYIAYEAIDVASSAKRPVTFVFNGGPGSSSIWLHIGALGPRRVLMKDTGKPLEPPARVVDNEETWLGLTDLVFIDPVGTGYSRPAKGHKQSEFSGLREDTESVAEFIRQWTTRNDRWASPKYLAGESYGTTRAANLAGRLQDRYGMYLNGIVLVSAVLNFQTIRFDTGNDLPPALFLPSYTATAWYHRRLPADLQKDLRATLKEVEKFTICEYVPALAQGDALPAAERKELVKRLARYTGLSERYVEDSDLRIRMSRFSKELLRDQGRTIGRLDSRFLGIDRDRAGSSYEYDPSMAAIDGPFSSALKAYLRAELRYETDLTYETLTGRVRPWSYKGHQNRYVNVGEALRRAMTKNRNLRVFVASGYFDLATPYFAADYTFGHLGLPAELRDHVTKRTYEAGHMMYIHGPSRIQLKRDVAAFYAAAAKKPDE